MSAREDAGSYFCPCWPGRGAGSYFCPCGLGRGMEGAVSKRVSGKILGRVSERQYSSSTPICTGAIYPRLYKHVGIQSVLHSSIKKGL